MPNVIGVDEQGHRVTVPYVVQTTGSNLPPPAGGFFPLTSSGDFPVPAGHFASLPNDAAAAAMVHRSTWEPRPDNAPANAVRPPQGWVTPGVQAYPTNVWARVTGACPLTNATTDELIQWAAAKWGLSDEVIRAEMMQESHWHQNLKNSAGVPVFAAGYGDYNTTGSPNLAPAKAYNQSLGGTLIDPKRPNGPESFGISQCKWWTFRPNPPGTGFGSYPWTELSTSYALDFYAAVIRAQYEGLNAWMAGGYTAYKSSPGGTIGVWGSVGNWFGGDWNAGIPQSQWGSTTTGSIGYCKDVLAFLSSKPWLVSGF